MLLLVPCSQRGSSPRFLVPQPEMRRYALIRLEDDATQDVACLVFQCMRLAITVVSDRIAETTNNKGGRLAEQDEW